MWCVGEWKRRRPADNYWKNYETSGKEGNGYECRTRTLAKDKHFK